MYTNSEGKDFILVPVTHYMKSIKRNINTYKFAKELKENEVEADVPEGYKIIENKRTKFPFLTKIKQ